MMKKRVLSMLMVMIMMVSMLSVSVFAADHECTAATDAAWLSDDNYHWHDCANETCTVEDATQLPDYGAHVWGNDSVCDTCAYECKHAWLSDETEAVCKYCGAKHSHTDNLEWVKTDATNHWQVCKDCPVAAEKKYNEAVHTMVQNGTLSECSVCGYQEHVHVWKSEWVKTDANAHWHECEDTSCPVTDNASKGGYAAHTMVQNGTVSACSVCGYSKHVHVWSTTVSKDANEHWYACTDSTCGDRNSVETHYDHNSSYTCDVCDTNIPVQTMEILTLTGASEPAEGALVDFTVSAAEDRFGTPEVKWNRVVDLSKNTSVALGEGSYYAAGYMYNTSILVPMNSRDMVSDNIQITLNGVNVPYYKTDAAFQNAIKSFEGLHTLYAAKAMWTNDYLCICVSVMYPTTPGTHVHDFSGDYYETPAKHHDRCIVCGVLENAEYHYDSNKSGLCDVCGYNMNYYNPNAPTYSTTTGTGTATTTHTHTYSSDWVEDISNHWKQCTGCGAKTQTAAHADLNNTGKCDVCGFVMTAAAGHTHTFATEWTETFAQHYKVCSCGAKNEIAAHVDLNNTGKCDTCGYAMTTLSNNGIVADTGDDNATFLWMAAFAVSVMGAGATVLFARKKREE